MPLEGHRSLSEAKDLSDDRNHSVIKWNVALGEGSGVDPVVARCHRDISVAPNTAVPSDALRIHN